MLVRQIRLKLYMFTTSPVSILYNDVKKKFLYLKCFIFLQSTKK